MSKRNTVALAAVLMMVVLGCSGKKEENGKGASAESVSKTMITFGSTRYLNGTLKPFILAADDRVALVHAASGERCEVAPVTTGDNSSMFLSELKKPATGDLLVGYYPVSEKVSVSATAVKFNFPAAQDGRDFNPVYLGASKNSGSAYAGNAITLSPVFSLVQASVQKGAYSVEKAVLKGNNGEKIAGELSWDPSVGKMTGGSQDAITVTLPTPLDCTSDAQNVPIVVPPMTLENGFTITFTLTNGQVSEYTTSESVTFAVNGVLNTNPASSGRQLLACGSGKVYLFDEKIASEAGRYNPGLIWTWVARDHASEIGRTISADDHIDDAKPVDGNKNILVTSSNGWAALVEIATGKVLWSAINISNAHSAEVLPGGLIAVAVSTGVDAVKLYDRKTPNVELGSYPLKSAHGVVWSEKMQRLYAVGETSVQIFSLSSGGTPALKLERTETSSGYVSGLHDATLVDENTLILGGSKVALFNLTTRMFTGLAHFNSFAGVKSINYNPATGEAYYTYAWAGNSEGAYDWSTHTIRYTDDVYANDGGTDKKTIKVDDINMYKVRVFNW